MQSSVRVELEPETVLPSQLIGSGRFDASAMPEKRLMLAVLEDAVITFQRYATSTRRRGRRLFSEAEVWILSDEADWTCSFLDVCDALGLDSRYLRQGLLAWRDRQRSEGATPTAYRQPFRRLSGSRTRAMGRPIGLGSRPSPSHINAAPRRSDVA